MKRIISTILIIACCFCQYGCKQKKENTKDTINPAFLSKKSMDVWCEEQNFMEWDDVCPKIIDFCEFEVSDEAKSGEHYISNTQFNEWVNENVGDKMIFYFSPTELEGTVRYKHNWFMYYIFSTDSFNYSCPYTYLCPVLIPSPQGLNVRILLKEDFTQTENFDTIEGYLKEVSLSTQHSGTYGSRRELKLYDTFPISSNAYLTYGVSAVKRNVYDDDVAKYCMYMVAIRFYSPETDTMLQIFYSIPVKDNEDEIQMLRDFGIPVITDFITLDIES